MSKYTVHITKAAERDVANASNYIDLVLKNPTATDALLDEFEAQVMSLESMPERNSLARDEILASWKIRYLLIKNYMAFYIIDEPSKTVHIIRFLYGKSNWMATLKGVFSID